MNASSSFASADSRPLIVHVERMLREVASA